MAGKDHLLDCPAIRCFAANTCDHFADASPASNTKAESAAQTNTASPHNTNNLVLLASSTHTSVDQTANTYRVNLGPVFKRDQKLPKTVDECRVARCHKFALTRHPAPPLYRLQVCYYTTYLLKMSPCFYCIKTGNKSQAQHAK